MLFDEARQLFHAQDRLCNLLLSPALRLDIERGDDFEPFLFEAAIREQCQTKMADTNEDHWLQPGGPELVGNPPRELTYIIPQTACAELAKISEIFAQLGRLDPGYFRQRFTRHGLNGVLLEARQAPEIDRQTVNRLAGNLSADGFLQCASNSQRKLEMQVGRSAGCH